MLTKKEKMLRHRNTKGYLKKKNKQKHKSEIKSKMREARKKVIGRDGHECQICKVLGMPKKLQGHNCQVHHIIPKTFCKKEYEHLLYNENNLILLCFKHHHIDSGLSPHMNALAWTNFLKKYYPNLYNYALNYINFPIQIK